MMRLTSNLEKVGVMISGLRTAIALVIMMATIPALAEDAKTPPLPDPLQNMVAQGAQIRYLGREYGLDGWVTIQNGEEQYFYVTADGQALLLGILFNNKGDAVTLRQINALREKEGPAIDRLAGYTPPPKKEISSTETAAPLIPDMSDPQSVIKSAVKSKAEQLYDAVETSNWVALGAKDAPAIYTFIDPECPHCHDLVEDFRKSGLIEKGLVQIRLIPVGVLSEKSLHEAAYLLASPDPQKDFYNHLDGKPDALLVDRSANTQGVQRNMQVMQDWKLDATPFSVYKDMSGSIKILQGRPANVKELIVQLR